MSIPTSLRDVFIGANAAGGPNFDLIENSLRFRRSQYLERSPGNVTPTNNKIFTLSVWAKYNPNNTAGGPGDRFVWACTVTNTYNWASGFSGNSGPNRWQLGAYPGSPSSFYSSLASDRSFRDPAAWYHIVLRWDTTQSTASNRVKVWTNGEEITWWTGTVVRYPDQNSVCPWNDGQSRTQRLGYANFFNGVQNQFDGYMAEAYCVDGQALSPTDFGEYDANGVWVPKKYSGTYGNQGFYLDFSDPSNIGADRSGNGNNFTPSGFELSNTSNSLYDWTIDSPTNSTPIINSLINDGNTPTISEANQRIAAPNGSGFQFATVPLPKSGKWYFEYEQISGTGGYGVGLFNSNGGGVPGYNYTGIQYRPDGTVYLNGSLVRNVGWSGSYVGLEVDMDNYQVEAFIGGSSFGGKYNLTTGLEYLIYVACGGGGQTQDNRMNFGQRAFSRTPTSGYIPLRTAELPEVDIKDPSDYFQTVLDTGANILSSAQSTFSNGLWWIKDRANSNQHQFVDSVRGSTNALTSPNDVAESTYSAPSGNSVAWCWSAPEAWSNSAGSNGANIASSGRRNLDTGFSIVNYSGRRPTSSTLAHGLNQAPEFIICKTRNTTYSFHVHHKSIGSSYVLILDTSQSKLSSSGSFSSINSSTFTVGNDAGTNEVGTNNMIAWCWHSVPGYSRFGSYVGNANSDGPFVYCGFRPAFVMIKITSSSGGWSIFDTSRDTYNPALKTLKADEQTQEQSNSSIGYDLVSNGFKIRTSNSDYNSSGGEFIYMAFAEHPFGGSNVYPTPAR